MQPGKKEFTALFAQPEEGADVDDAKTGFCATFRCVEAIAEVGLFPGKMNLAVYLLVVDLLKKGQAVDTGGLELTVFIGIHGEYFDGH